MGSKPLFEVIRLGTGRGTRLRSGKQENRIGQETNTQRRVRGKDIKQPAWGGLKRLSTAPSHIPSSYRLLRQVPGLSTAKRQAQADLITHRQLT